MQGFYGFVRFLPNFGFLNEKFCFIPLTKNIMNGRFFQLLLLRLIYK